MSTQLLEKNLDAQAQKAFNSLTPDQLARLEALFHQEQNRKILRNASVAAGVAGVGVMTLGAGGAYAAAPAAGDASAAAAASIASGVT